MDRDLERQSHLVRNLFRSLAEATEDPDSECIETHISWVLLAGEFAFKIKKPLNLGFLDFSTLARRHHCCAEEIRLNRRLAPDIYLDVAPVTGTIEWPSLSAAGQAIEYSVRMRRFPRTAILLSDHPEALTEKLMESLAHRVASFHRTIDQADPVGPFGLPERILEPVRQNVLQLSALVHDPPLKAALKHLESWTMEQFHVLKGVLAARRSDGFVRECHGDLHLGNIALDRDRLIIFDGIEFNPDLSWVDTMSELAFLLMDIEEKGKPRMAQRLLDSYLDATGDYQGLSVLRFYKVYRAMVRAKVSALRAAQDDASAPEKRRLACDLRLYLRAAGQYTRPIPAALLITYGVSASGKSTLCRALTIAMPAIRLRSDVERKRLAGLHAEQASNAPLGGGIYSATHTQKTYDRLRQLSGNILSAGYHVIVDATFLDRLQRNRFMMLAHQLRVSFLILDFQIPTEELRRRIVHRQLQGGDPSEADMLVLEGQLESRDPLSVEELRHTLPVTVEHSPSAEEVLGNCNRMQP